MEFGYKCQVKPAIAHRYEPPFGLVDDRVRYVLPQPAKWTLRWHEEIAAPEGLQGSAAQ